MSAWYTLNHLIRGPGGAFVSASGSMIGYILILLVLASAACDYSNGGDASATLQFTQPAADAAPIPFNAPTRLVAQYLRGGRPVSGVTVGLAVDRGTLSLASPPVPCSTPAGSTPVASLEASTDASGQASAYLCSDGASGSGGVAASAEVSGGPSASLNLSFVATTPASVAIDASPSTIHHAASSTVTARVFDTHSNPVPGQKVDFSLNDPSGGTLSAAAATTDQSGSASVLYRPTTSSNNNATATVSATADGIGVATASPAQITVVGGASHISLGTSNRISVDQGHYALPYVVIVSDSAGNPIANATVNLAIQSVAYQKGQWIACNTAQGATLSQCQTSSPPAWAQVTAVPSSDPHYNKAPAGQAATPLDQSPFGCITEDPGNTGIYSHSLDYNNNGVLDPGAPATVPATVQLDSAGSAQFSVTYPEDHAAWVEVAVTASIDTVANHTVQVLPIAAADVSNSSVPPPGATSPYGKAAVCTNPG